MQIDIALIHLHKRFYTSVKFCYVSYVCSLITVNTNISLCDICILNWSRVFVNGPGDRGSIPGQVMSKTQK